MIELSIPSYGDIKLEHLVLDLNGTIAGAGEILEGVAEGITTLAGVLTPILVTADTRGTAAAIGERLGITVRVIPGTWEAGEKLELVQELGADRVVAIGNGSNDALMFKSAGVGICVIGPEGASKVALEAADIVVTDIRHAFALLAEPTRLLATLRS